MIAGDTIEIPAFNWSYRAGGFAIRSPLLTIEPGQTYYLFGPSGSGKTTFLDLLVQSAISEDPASSPICGWTWKGSVAYLMHASSLAPWLTLKQNLDTEARLRAKQYDKKLLGSLLSALELDRLDIETTLPRQLSHGMRQRFELIQALCFEPRLLIIDEGLSGIHQPLRDKAIRALAKNCLEQGTSLVFTSHNLADAMRFADEVVHINEGQINEPVALTPHRSERLVMSPEQLFNLPDMRRLAQENC